MTDTTHETAPTREKKADVTFPRLVYRGPSDDQAQTMKVEDKAAYEQAQKNGWRLQRGGANAPKEDLTGLIDIPAQKIATIKAPTLPVPGKFVKGDDKIEAPKHNSHSTHE